MDHFEKQPNENKGAIKMKVGELVELLQKQDQNAIVVCAIDPEGHGFNELEDHGHGNWDAEDRQFWDSSHSADDCCMDEDQYSEMRKLPKCFLLWP